MTHTAAIEGGRQQHPLPEPFGPEGGRADHDFPVRFGALGWFGDGEPQFALRYGDSTAFGTSALMAAGLALFIMTLIVNFIASSIVARSRSGAGTEA